MSANAIARFLEAIGYPERASDGASSFTLQVDGGEIVASAEAGALRLVCPLSDDPAQLPRLAEYAAGRMLREDAVLAFGSAEGLNVEKSKVESSGTLQPFNLQPSTFLWQDIPATADAHDLRRFFETFCDSCDWWRARLEAEKAGGDAGEPSGEMMIRP